MEATNRIRGFAHVSACHSTSIRRLSMNLAAAAAAAAAAISITGYRFFKSTSDYLYRIDELSFRRLGTLGTIFWVVIPGPFCSSYYYKFFQLHMVQ
jgi:hypothetical protein